MKNPIITYDIAMITTAFLFTGENTYTLRQEYIRWKTSFVEKYWRDSLFVFNSENWDFWAVRQALYAWGLFVTKKMIVLEWIPKDLSQDWGLWADKIDQFIEDFSRNAQYLSQDTMVIFICSKPDKRTKSYKWLAENIQVKSFDPLKDSEVRSFIKEQIKPYSFWEGVADYFFEKVGNDLYRIVNEIEKLKYWVPDEKVISKEDVDNYVFWMVEANVFSLFDTLFLDPQKAVKMLEKMQDEWKDWNAVLNPLMWTLKVYLTLIDYVNQGITDNKQIISETKLSPFAVAKNMKNISVLKMHGEYLKRLLVDIVDTEYWIKSWKYPDIYFWITLKKKFLTLTS